MAKASKKSLGQAAKATERSKTLDRTPNLAGALDDGAITADHVDAVTRASTKLDGAKRDELITRADKLADVAKAGTVDEFARRLDLEAKNLQEGDGMDRLERQRRNARARSWVDSEGMWNLSDGPVDEGAPGGPARPSPRPQPSRPRPGQPEFIAVIDADVPGQDGPDVEFSIPVEIPARVLASLAGTADIHAVVVRNGVVLYAPGELDLGRSTRLANRAQRRALRGLYRVCAIPGCTVGYDRCKLHHIIWWQHGGRTDLDNLLPVCSVHHTKIHNDGWVIELGPHRELTLRLPDGSIHTSGPPNRRTAA